MALDIAGRQRLQRLMDAYGELLTGQQRRTLELYVDRDWSYAEIARSQGVSRTAVYDMVHRSQAVLDDYEAKLRLLAVDDRRRQGRSAIDARLDDLQAELGQLRKSVKELS